MQSNGQVLGVSGKIRVGREDRGFVTVSNSANQHIDVGTGDAARSAGIEETRCLNEIDRLGLEIAKGREFFRESLEDRVAPDARQNLLVDWTDQSSPAGVDEVLPFGDELFLAWRELVSPSPEGKGPDGRVDENGHRGLRSRRRFGS